VYTGSHSVLDNASALHAQGPGFNFPLVQYVLFQFEIIQHQLF